MNSNCSGIVQLSSYCMAAEQLLLGMFDEYSSENYSRNKAVTCTLNVEETLLSVFRKYTSRKEISKNILCSELGEELLHKDISHAMFPRSQFHRQKKADCLSTVFLVVCISRKEMKNFIHHGPDSKLRKAYVVEVFPWTLVRFGLGPR
ncbi:uncharacterized protein LOC102563423 isoform X3 [Alligator mississippiensis]|uniref:uncharacterized protein LOC102563423 isoform X3 n=1 Tax=Alligator mississippiensis TaxID=8496 RepID=UPI0009073DF5|nr:uncharacterized protein LOC102563423 isoform X3 [Alligator mississippiensis]